MSTTPEGKLVAKTMKWLRSLPDTYAVKISDMNNVGLPDIFGHHKGIAFYFEMKSERGRLSERQHYELEKIGASGGRAAVCRSLDDIQVQMIRWFSIDEIYCSSIRPKAHLSRAGEVSGQ